MCCTSISVNKLVKCSLLFAYHAHVFMAHETNWVNNELCSSRLPMPMPCSLGLSVRPAPDSSLDSVWEIGTSCADHQCGFSCLVLWRHVHYCASTFWECTVANCATLGNCFFFWLPGLAYWSITFLARFRVLCVFFHPLEACQGNSLVSLHSAALQLCAVHRVQNEVWLDREADSKSLWFLALPWLLHSSMHADIPVQKVRKLYGQELA